MSKIPRAEYPRPQFERSSWVNLNGVWSYEFDFGESGMARGLEKSTGFAGQITVPFCPESKLSGVQYKDFINQMFYHRKLKIPADWKGKSILLQFGGMDSESEVFINGESVGIHYGGMAGFAHDITPFVKAGKTYDLVVRAKDDNREGLYGSGKQSTAYASAGCLYTRVTGIWQTVWMEALDFYGLKRCFVTPDLDGKAFAFRPEFLHESRNHKLRVTISGKGVKSVIAEKPAVSGISFSVPLGSKVKPWSPEDPFLYDIVYELFDEKNQLIDRVVSYAGLRKVHIEGDKFFLNNKPCFQRLVLDQGFYEDGIWTAPSDAALKKDIELGIAAGFNGARLHQKVFEERYHYWADKLGYLTWGESASWGMIFCGNCQEDSAKAWRSQIYFYSEWRSVIERDYNSPSIVAWTPLNETWPWSNVGEYRRVLGNIYDFTRSIDPTRPVNETSGWHHAKTDLWTVHLYCSNAENLQKCLNPEDGSPVYMKKNEAGYCGQPYLVDEWGGFKYIPADRSKFAENSWGYHGLSIQSAKELCEKIREQAYVMNTDPRIWGWCYTQLTDVEQEQNGVYNYDRTPKGNMKLFKAAFCAGLEKRKNK